MEEPGCLERAEIGGARRYFASIHLGRDARQLPLGVLVAVHELRDGRALAAVPAVLRGGHELLVHDAQLHDRGAEAVEAAVDALEGDRRTCAVVEFLQLHVHGVVPVDGRVLCRGQGAAQLPEAAVHVDPRPLPAAGAGAPLGRGEALLQLLGLLVALRHRSLELRHAPLELLLPGRPRRRRRLLLRHRCRRRRGHRQGPRGGGRRRQLRGRGYLLRPRRLLLRLRLLRLHRGALLVRLCLRGHGLRRVLREGLPRHGLPGDAAAEVHRHPGVHSRHVARARAEERWRGGGGRVASRGAACVRTCAKTA
mmetsp:Transcript_82313/g.230923  ORF Transcript_82313/g.230923 Transcript_82313/m.230923 type:complete len:309 (-) Transcript_82313:2-928(-)